MLNNLALTVVSTCWFSLHLPSKKNSKTFFTQKHNSVFENNSFDIENVNNIKPSSNPE